MALPKLPAFNTARLRCLYLGETGEHSVQFRVVDGLSTSIMLGLAATVVESFTALQFTTVRWGTVEFIARGTNISNPIGLLDLPGQVPGTPDPRLVSAFLCFGGRSADGRLGDWTIFEQNLLPNSRMRILQGVEPRIQVVCDALRSVAGRLVLIGGQPPVIRPYANMGYNAAVQRKQRDV